MIERKFKKLGWLFIWAIIFPILFMFSSDAFAANTITVTSPNGGEIWPLGSIQTINWTYSGTPGANVKIELYRGYGLSKLITASTPIGSGSYTWTVPSWQTVDSSYSIKITSTSNTGSTDTSNGKFTITNVSTTTKPTITVSSPNGGEKWQQGSAQTIRWSYTGNPGTVVKVELLQGGGLARVLTSSMPIGSNGSGSFSWTVPSSQAVGSDYQVRVTSINNSAYTDSSNNNFTITAVSSGDSGGSSSGDAGASSGSSAPTGVALAGVHWYSGDSGMLDMGAPSGKRGWNVEAIYDANSGGGSVRGRAQTAKDHGMVNIIRIDYRNYQAVPRNSSEYDSWVNGFNRCIQDLRDIATLFIVGNEPNLEGGITPDQYAAAFNYLFARKPAGVDLLVAGPSGFSDPSWLGNVANRIGNTDGFALHTYGDPTLCSDPRRPCPRGGWYFDGGFLYFKSLIDQIPSKFWPKPVYITEFNTDVNGKDQSPNPIQNYQDGWINKAFQAVRDYNASRGSKPEVKALAWYVDRDDGGWGDFALRNITAAREDMACEMKNPVNRGGSANNCPVDGTQPPQSSCIANVPTDRWKGEYFSGINLSGSALMVRDDGAGVLDFDWGGGSPGSGCGILADNFSVRWTRTVYFNAGNYEFSATADDGVRLWIDGQLKIDRWVDQAPTTYKASVNLSAGNHTLKMEYYEKTGGAVAKLSWQQVGAPLPSTGTGTNILVSGWEDGESEGFRGRVEYSNNVAGYFNSSTPPPECHRWFLNTAHTGSRVLRIAGYSQATYAYCYYRVFDVDIPVKSGLKLSYWIYHAVGTPRVSVDGHFTDGSVIRDFKNSDYLKDQYNIRIHPSARQDPMHAWYYVEVDLSPAAGKMLDYIMFAFDNGGNGFTGQYETYVDDFRIFYNNVVSLTDGNPKGIFGSGAQTDEVTEPNNWRWSERFYGHQGIDRIAWMYDSCGGNYNYVIGGHQNDLVEYLMKFGGQYSRLVLRGMASRPGPVEMEIYVDGQYRGKTAWDADNGCNQDVAVEIKGIPYGTHAIAVKFVNDYSDPTRGMDRNFFLDGLYVAPTASPSIGWAYPVGSADSASGWEVTTILGESFYLPSTGKWYRGHLGEDWAKSGGGSLGQPVYTAAAGKIVIAIPNCGNYLNVVVIEHNVAGFVEPIYSFYGHIESEGFVKEGDWVEKSQQIGTIGNPSPYNPHLHFEIKNRTALINPPFSPCTDTSGRYISAGYSGISNDYLDSNDYYDPSDTVNANRFYHPRRFIEGHK